MEGYEEILRRDYKKQFVYMFLFLIMFAAVTVLLLPAYWYLWLVFMAVSAFVMYQVHKRVLCDLRIQKMVELEVKNISENRRKGQQ